MRDGIALRKDLAAELEHCRTKQVAPAPGGSALVLQLATTAASSITRMQAAAHAQSCQQSSLPKWQHAPSPAVLQAMPPSFMLCTGEGRSAAQGPAATRRAHDQGRARHAAPPRARSSRVPPHLAAGKHLACGHQLLMFPKQGQRCITVSLPQPQCSTRSCCNGGSTPPRTGEACRLTSCAKQLSPAPPCKQVGFGPGPPILARH